MPEQSIINQLVAAIEERDSAALMKLFDNYAEIRDPFIGVVRRKYAKYYSTVLLTFSSQVNIHVWGVTENKNMIYAQWEAKLNTMRPTEKTIKVFGCAYIELRWDKIYRLKLNFNYWLVLGNLFGLKGYLLGITNFWRHKLRRNTINQIKQMLPENSGGMSFAAR